MHLEADDALASAAARLVGTAVAATAMTSLDAHSAEQDLLLNAFHLSQRERNEASADDPWSAAGPSSVSPFVPCAFGRIPAALRAARLTSDDVLWDLGCGDGRVLLQAAAQYGCRCVGLDIDADCIRDATAQAAACGLGERCVFATCDLLALPPRALRNGVAGGTSPSSAPRSSTPPPPSSSFRCRRPPSSL